MSLDGIVRGERALVLAVVALVLAACGAGTTADTALVGPSSTATAAGETVETTATPLERDDLPPADVTVSVEPDAGTSGVIGPAGGMLTTAHDGVTYTLSIPEGALLSDVEIGMTAISGLQGDAVGDAASVGVRLEPDGLLLLAPATLEVAGSGIDDAVAFAARGEGTDFHLVPSLEGRLELMGFSVHGFAEATISAFAESYRPQSTATAASHQLALAIESDQPALAVEVLTLWAQEISHEIVDLPNRGLGYQDQVAAEVLLWMYLREQIAVSLELSVQQAEQLTNVAVGELFNPFASWLSDESGRLIDRCISEEAPEYALVAARWSIIYQLGFSRAGGPWDLGFEAGDTWGWAALERCLGGELHYQADLVGESVDDIIGSIEYEASARIPVEFASDRHDFAVASDGTGLLRSPWMEGPWTLDGFAVTGEDVRCVEPEYRSGVARAQIAWVNVELNLARYDDEDLEPPVVLIEIGQPFSIKCQGLELAHLAHNQLVLANAERFPEARRGRFVFATEYDTFTTNFVTASSEQDRGDLFGAQWEIDQRVDWTWPGGG